MRILPVLLPLVAIATLAFTAAGGAGGLPPDRLLGVRLGMTDQEARAALVKIGAVTRGADTRRQTWEIRDPRYRYLVVRLDDEWRVKWMTVFARPGGRSIRYRDVGDLSRGHRVGYYSWVWTLPAGTARDSIMVSARGADSTYLTTLSMELRKTPARSAGGSGADSTR